MVFHLTVVTPQILAFNAALLGCPLVTLDSHPLRNILKNLFVSHHAIEFPLHPFFTDDTQEFKNGSAIFTKSSSYLKRRRPCTLEIRVGTPLCFVLQPLWDWLFFWQKVPDGVPLEPHRFRLLNPLVITETALDLLHYPPPTGGLWGWEKVIHPWGQR